MKQTKQSILFSFVLAVMMLVGANTAFGQLIATNTTGASTTFNTCDVANWNAAIAAAGDGGAISITNATTCIIPGGATEATASVLVNKNVTLTTTLANAKVTVGGTVLDANNAAVGGTAFLTVEAGKTLTVNKGVLIQVGGVTVAAGAGPPLQVLATGTGVLQVAANGTVVGTIALASNGTGATPTDASAINVIDTGTLTNNGVITTLAPGTAATTISQNSAVYYTAGTIGGTGAFGNIFIIGAFAPTATLSHTYRIAPAREVRIAAAITLPTTLLTGISFVNSDDVAAAAATPLVVRHLSGTISVGNATGKLTVGGDFVVAGTGAWTPAAGYELNVLRDATFTTGTYAFNDVTDKITVGRDLTIAVGTFTASKPIISVVRDITISEILVDPTSVTMTGGTTSARSKYNFATGVAITTLTINGNSASLADYAFAGAVIIGTSGSLNVDHDINLTAGAFTVGNGATATIKAGEVLTATVTNKGTLANFGTITASGFTNGNNGISAAALTGSASFTNHSTGVVQYPVDVAVSFTNERYANSTYDNNATIDNYGYLNLQATTAGTTARNATFNNFGGTITLRAPTVGATNSGTFLLNKAATGTVTFLNTQTYSTTFRNATASITNNGIFTVGGAVTNNATIVNNAIPTVVATTLDMSVTGAFTNSVSFVSLATGYVMTSGTLTNNGVLDITGAVINKGTFTNNRTLSVTSFVNDADETTVANVGFVKTTPSAANSGYFTVTGAVTNSGGIFTNSDTLSVGTSLTNSFKALSDLVVREISTFTNSATGVVLAKRAAATNVDLGNQNAKRFVQNSGSFNNNGSVQTDSLRLVSTPVATTGTLFALLNSSFTNAGTLLTTGFSNVAGGASVGTSVYTNSGTTTISVGVGNPTTGAAALKAAGTFGNAGTYTNNGGTTTFSTAAWTGAGTLNVTDGTVSRTGNITLAGAVNISGGTTSIGLTTNTNNNNLAVSGGLLTITGALTNSAAKNITVSGTGEIFVVGSLTNDGIMTRGSTTASGTGKFVVRGTLTNNSFINRTTGTNASPAGSLTTALRAAQGTGYLEGVLTAAAIDGIVVHGTFANSGTYEGNVIVSSDAFGITPAGTRAISGAGTFGGLTLVGDGIKTLSNNITVNQLFLRGGRLNAVAVEGETTTTARTVTVAGAAPLANEATQTFVNGLSANGVFVGTDARWSDLVTVTMGTANLFASLGQMTATLANGPLSVPAGTTQLVGNAFVKSALIAGKVNRLSCFTFTTVVAMVSTSADNVIVPDVCEVEEVDVAAVQIINNVAGSTYDVTFNGESFATDLAYQTATEVDLFEAGDATFVFTQGTKSYTFEVTLEESNPFSNDNYILIIQGDADGVAGGKAVELVMVPYARFLTNNAATMQFIFNHGVTNGPAVTVERVSTSTPRTLEQLIAVNATYGSVTQYLTQTDPSYTTLRMKAGGAVVGQYLFDFTGYGAQAVTLLATGRVGGAGANALMIIAVDAAGDVMRPAVTTSDDNDSDVAAEIPAEFTLNGNFPNPFNPTTNISFDLPEQANVRIEIIDLLGRQVMAIAPQSMSAGANKIITVDAARLSSGVYFYRLIAEGSTKTFVQGSKFTLVK